MRNIDIKIVRIKRGLTQSDFAKLLGVSTNTVSRWEMSSHAPSPMAMKKLLSLYEEEKEKTCEYSASI